jgi:hypothetical protein
MNPSYYDETVPPFARFFGRSLRENQLCEDCIKFPFEVFFLKEPAPLDPQIVFRRLDSVKANSRTCPFCRLLHRAAFTFAYREFTRYGRTAKRSENIKKPANRIQSPSFFHFIRRAEDALEGYYDAIHPSVLLASLVLENHIRDGRESIPNLNFYITPLETDPGTISTDCGHIIKPTQVNFQLAKTWLKNCVDNHGGACARNPWVEDSAAATEIWVIDVIDQCIRSIANSERFIALSYVWGGYTPRPLARNLVDYLERLSQPLSLQKSIPKLPKTIRDAIYTVKNIGERYLWVDSLCIPPDPAIKADQINNMDQVY